MYPANNPFTLRSDIADVGATPSGCNHLTRYFEVWKHLPPPLRPARTVVELVERHIEDRDAPAFLMGVTPDLSAVTTDLTAMDHTPQMIRHIWPGDTAHRRALFGNWLDTKGSAKAANFPTRAQLQVTMPRSFAAVRFVPATGYELCERCPMLVIEV